MDRAREELADSLYNGLEEELALAALKSPWLTPLVNERRPAHPEPQRPNQPQGGAPQQRFLRPIPERQIYLSTKSLTPAAC